MLNVARRGLQIAKRGRVSSDNRHRGKTIVADRTQQRYLNMYQDRREEAIRDDSYV